MYFYYLLLFPPFKDTKSYYYAQAVSRLQDSSGPPASACPLAGTTGVHYHAGTYVCIYLFTYAGD
jgi:hypothetical protein